ncbi:hypothetical protein [Xenorhabdus griffiniae]|uniref:Inverse autotransporter beta-barrel domain-containing protein n=1 Tax=Xenorhabdus griffiniae TaxID=351672 RepID=A0ABY9XKI4_9GAMM|nr:hypothetical protein [Xenorhabdus griffiniae]MBD1228902.1 hypothetical protein [Xenorhabdus griffiniae]MBE8589253.1 hypothetical protein [Xenorhabdus griffiniae]WMV73381.1 hypothetical protein QL128_04940 [Xenorhabdus griffiniae]WNH03060.1 hypothetical protein QL112_004945 [Xenorhabdus griffiniae]
MANMTTVPADGKNIIKGQPFSVVVSINGENNIQSTVEVSAVLPPGVKLLKTFPGKVDEQIFSQQLIFQADESSDTHTISFTSNSPSGAHTDVTYHPVDNPDLNPDTCVLRGTAAYLYDSKPVGLTGPAPGKDNPFVSASINPMLKQGGGAISNYDIPLRTTAPLRIFTEDMDEIYPYDIDRDNKFYYYLIQKTSSAAVNLKIYATQNVHKFVTLDTIFNDEEYNQKQTIFITTVPTDVSSSLEPPSIEETLSSSTLTRPDQADEFTVMVPSYKTAQIGDFIIGFVTDDKKDIFKTELFAGQITSEENGYYKFKAAYSDLYSGDNHLCYVALDQTGMPVRSKFNYINYDNGGINGPSSNDKHRTLVEPKVYDQDNQFIGLYDPINIDSIGQKGLEIRLPSDPNDYEHTIAAGDKITITAYISHCIDTLPEKNRPMPISVLKNYIVQKSEISNGYFKFQLTADKLIGYAVADDYDVGLITIVYSRLAPAQKSKLYTRSFGTVAL